MEQVIIDNIRQCMEEKGLKQLFVAQKAGFTGHQFSDMLAGRKVIRAEFVPRIANALGVDVNTLYKERQQTATQ